MDRGYCLDGMYCCHSDTVPVEDDRLIAEMGNILIVWVQDQFWHHVPLSLRKSQAKALSFRFLCVSFQALDLFFMVINNESLQVGIWCLVER
jgi:hypothetical protein